MITSYVFCQLFVASTCRKITVPKDRHINKVQLQYCARACLPVPATDWKKLCISEYNDWL